jgi:Transposase DDE domain
MICPCPVPVSLTSSRPSSMTPVLIHFRISLRMLASPILTFLAQDADSQVFCYSNADIRKGEEVDEIFRFIAFWKKQYGSLPQHLVFDSKLTTYDRLDRLDAAGITFITLRRRSPSLLAEIDSLPPSAWRTVKLEISGRKHRTPRYYEQKARPHKRDLRQFFITDLGHDEPTILLTNDTKSTAKAIITRYAKRMLIENALCDAVRFFHIDALSSSVGLKVDFDMALLVVASGLYRMMARRMRGYDDAQARQIFRDLIDMPADVAITEAEITVRFHRRAHLPIVLASGLIDKPVAVPWWNDRLLCLVQ